MRDELSFVGAFVKRSRRGRYREFVADPALRHKFIRDLATFRDFEPRCRLPFASDKLFAGNTSAELFKRHAPELVYVISENSAIDRQVMSLVKALEQVVGQGMGTVLYCIDRRLAFVETEDERMILERHDPLERHEYIRFVVGRIDEDSHVEQGVFQAASLALRWGDIEGADVDALSEVREWFSRHLERPNSFGRDRNQRAICWFKTCAHGHIAQIWAMVQILERNGIYVKKIETDTPGYVVYEDECQLGAEPFRAGRFQKK